MLQTLQKFARFQTFQLENMVDFEKILKNAYLLAKIGADTAENELNFAEILPIGRCRAACRKSRRAEDDARVREDRLEEVQVAVPRQTPEIRLVQSNGMLWNVSNIYIIDFLNEIKASLNRLS